MTPAEQNRRDFPEFAKFVDELRRVFGPDVRVRWVAGEDKSLGKVPDEFKHLAGTKARESV